MDFLFNIIKSQRRIIKWGIWLVLTFIAMMLFLNFASSMYLHFFWALCLLIFFDFFLYFFTSKFLINDYMVKQKVLYTAVYFLPLALILFTCIIPFIIPYYEWHPVARSRFIGIVMILAFTKCVFYFIYIVGIAHFIIRKLFLNWKMPYKAHDIHIIRFFKPYTKVSYILCIISLFLFGLAFSYGERRVDLEKVSVKINRLPDQFKDYKIVHISDFHLGSVSKSTVSEIIATVNSQNPDMVCFTGDLVTYSSKEIEPFQKLLKEIKARDGVFAVLGNHDYGTYSQYKDKIGQEEEHQKIVSYIRDSLHWHLLNNESIEIKKGESSAILIGGIENLSVTKRFISRGDIRLAFERKNLNMPVILLSHDPSVWITQITEKFPFIDLTLSGHTHGMQFGIPLENGIIKRRNKIRKREVRGMYKHNDQYLYISKGIGSSLLHGRLGMWADVSVITLEKGEG